MRLQLFLTLDKKRALYTGVITRTVMPSSQSTNPPQSCKPPPHTLTHALQFHYLSKEKQLPQNRTFSIKETRIPLTFKKKKKKGS